MSNPADSSDDLIAELAKLMASEAQGDRPSPRETTAPRLVSESRPQTGQGAYIRIPGEDRPVLIARPDVDAAAAPARPAALQPQAPKIEAPVQQVQTEAPAPAKPQIMDFDFGFNSPAKVPEPAPELQLQAKVPEALPEPASDASSTHDAIADLIAAEFAAAPKATAPAPEPLKPSPVAAQQNATPVVEPEPELIPEPQRHDSVTEAAAPEAVEPPQAPPVSAPQARGPLSQVNSVRPRLRQVAVSPQRRPESDSFVIAPVIGLGSGRRIQAETQQAPAQLPPQVPAQARDAAPQVAPPVPQHVTPPVPARREPSFASNHSDPLAEIESLIGEAVRVEVDKPVRQAPPPVLQTPVVATPPRKSSIRAPKRNASNLDEEAILAAAAVSGSEVSTLEDEGDDSFATPLPVRAGRSFGRALMGPAVALTLLGGAGFGLYWVLSSGSSSTEAPVLVADTTPARQQPLVEANSGSQQRSVVFDEIDGVTTPASAEQLVPRDQTEIAEVTQPVVDTEAQQELANRRVRTVTVRPDGTIVSGDSTLAANDLLPVDRPDVPEVPGIASVEATNLLAGATSALQTSSAVNAFAAQPEATLTTTEIVDPTQVASLSQPATAAQDVGLAGGVQAAVVATDGVDSNNDVVVIPMPRPEFRGTPTPITSTANAPINAVVDEPVDLVANLAALELQPEAAPEPATQTAAVQQPAVNNAAAYIQLSSQRSEQAAMDTMSVLQNRYGSLFNGATMEVQRVDLGARGVYYRVRLPASSLSSANQVCSSIKSAGGECFTM